LPPTTSTSFLLRRCLSQETRTRIDSLVKARPLVVFMKGSPEMPQCGFSRATVQVLAAEGVERDTYDAHDVLADQEIRNGVKEYRCAPGSLASVTIPSLSSFRRPASGPPSPRSTSTANSSAAAISCSRCTRTASSQRSARSPGLFLRLGARLNDSTQILEEKKITTPGARAKFEQDVLNS
jgi:glutaredoxin-related protein